MTTQNKTKEQLIKELVELHERITNLENSKTESKRIEKRLQDGDKKYRGLVENIPDGVVVTDMNGIILHTNIAAAKMHGYTSVEEMIGKPFFEFIAKEDLLRIKNRFREFINKKEKTIKNLKVAGLKKDGSEISLMFNIHSLWDKNGKLIHSIAIGRDITERKQMAEELQRHHDRLEELVEKRTAELIRINDQLQADITERRHTEDELRKSEKRFRDISEATLMWVWEVDAQGKYIYASPNVEKILGYTPKEILGKHFYDLFHPENQQTLKKEAFKVFAKKQSFGNFINRNVHKNGHIVWLSTTGVPILNEKGNLLGYRGADADITERKRAEDALRESEERFRTIFETAQDSVFIKDRMHRYIQVNSAMERLFGLPSSKLIGRTDEDLFGKEAATHIKEVDSRVFDGEIIEEEHTKSVKGTMFTFHIIKVPLRNSPGEIIGLCGIARDITERKRAEDALRESEEKYRAAVKQSADNIYLLDTESKRILETNAALQNLLGYSAEEMRNLTVYDFVAHSKKDIDQKIEKMTKIKRFFIGERKYRRKDGSIVDVEVSANFINLKGKKVLFVLSRDITERKRVENALKESEEKYKTLTENINVGIYRNTVGPKGKFIEVNPAIIKMFGYNNKAEFLALDVADLYQDPKDRKKFNKKMLHQEFVKSEELKFKKKNGTLFIGSVSAVAVKNEKGEIKYYDGMVEDITERKRTEEQLAHMATHDPLTGLPNRILFKDRLEQALRHAHRKDQNLAVMLLDLDHFKNINDTLGHSVGDQLLHQVASRLINTLRKGDTVGRMGGDEFMLLLPEIIREEYATTVAKKILEAIRKLFIFDGHTLNVTTSIGIALYPHDAENGEMLMRNADIAMYRAKDKGRNDYQRYSPTFNTHNK